MSKNKQTQYNNSMSRIWVKLVVYALGICFVLSLLVCFLKFALPFNHKESVKFYANKYSLNTSLICALINTESHFNPNAKSNAGAIGLMQLMPKTAEHVADYLEIKNYNLFLPETNIEFGCFYLKELLNKYKSTKTALCAYNAGSGNIDLWLKNPNYSKDGKEIYYIPFKETRDYVRKINIFRTFYTKVFNL